MKTNNNGQRKVLTVHEAAAYLRCSESAIYRLLNSGDIPGFRLGGAWRFQVDVLDAWMRRGGTER